MVRHQLRNRGIRSEEVLRIMGTVPREHFLPPGQEREAYLDRALPLCHGQTISQPYMVAAMTEALELTGEERVLEVGTGSGYQTAILSYLAETVYSVERLAPLLELAQSALEGLGIGNVRFKLGDGTLGWEEQAPFHRILVTAGSPRPAPPSLLRQLSPDRGQLVIPLGDRQIQELVRITREGESYREDALLSCRFVPLLGEEGWQAPEPW
jgi:protein-L-isoaspartate(D-aspartate) O-methyltransferase